MCKLGNSYIWWIHSHMFFFYCTIALYPKTKNRLFKKLFSVKQVLGIKWVLVKHTRPFNSYFLLRSRLFPPVVYFSLSTNTNKYTRAKLCVNAELQKE